MKDSGPFPPYVYAGRMVEEDQEILKITSELCQQLKINNYNPGTVHWLEPRRGLHSDQPLVILNQLGMPNTLVGRLAPAEWKPLIASSLIYGRKFRGKRTRRSASNAVLGYLLVLGLLPLLFVATYVGLFFGLSERVAVEVGLIAWIAAGLPLYKLLQSGRSRKLRLTADQEAAKLVGRDLFLQVLRKIDQMSLEDVENRKSTRLSARFLSRPSISERIKSLENFSASSRDENYSWPYFNSLGNLVGP